MQKNPFEKLDSSHEHIPPSSENTAETTSYKTRCTTYATVIRQNYLFC